MTIQNNNSQNVGIIPEVAEVKGYEFFIYSGTEYKVCKSVTITNSAINRITSVAKKKSSLDGKDYFLRFGVSSGGCYGFSYTFKFDNVINEVDEVIVNNGKIICVLSPKILKFVNGATLDFIDEIASQHFTVISNPNSSGGCGCGNSFSV